MKTTLIILMGLCLIATSSTFAGYIFNESFEGGVVGQQMHGTWSYWETDPGNGLVSTTQASSGSKSIYFTDEPDGYEMLRKQVPLAYYPSSGTFKFSFYLDDGDTRDQNLVFRAASATGGDTAVYTIQISFSDKMGTNPGQGIWDYQNGAQLASSDSVTVFEWHDVQIDFDYTAGTYDLYFDDVFVATVNLGGATTDVVQYCMLGDAYSGISFNLSAYIDDYSLSTGAIVMVEPIDGHEVWFDDFESYDVGWELPINPWNWWNLDFDNGLVVEDQAYSPTKSVWMHAQPSGYEMLRRQLYPEEQLSKGAYEFAFYLNSADPDQLLVMRMAAATGTNAAVFVLKLHFSNIPGRGIIKYPDAFSDDSYKFAPADMVTPFEWHTVRVEFDHPNRSFSIVFDGELIADNAALTNGLATDTTRYHLVGDAYSYSWSLLDVYIDDHGYYDAIPLDKPEIIDIAMKSEGVALELDPYEEVGKEQVILWKDDMNVDWQVADSIAWGDTQTWVDEGGTGRSDPRDPSVSKRYYSVIGADPAPITALPGYYVACMKYVNDASDTQRTRLSMYTFNSDNTVTSQYWEWDISVSETWNGWSVSNKLIGDDGTDTPPGHVDETKYVVGLTKHLGDATNLTTITGTWSQPGSRRIDITWSDASTEKWYITWEDSGTLYKMEMYDASYIKSGTNFYLTSSLTEATRDVGAVNAAWAFGGNTRDFTYARPIGSEMHRNLDGGHSKYNGYLGTPEEGINFYQRNLASYYNLTDNDVLRRVFVDAGTPTSPYVYAYVAAPESNPGVLARRIVEQYGHDYAGNPGDGHIENDGGHVNAGLQIIDGAGIFRGWVQSEYMSGIWVAAQWFLDDTSDEAKTGVMAE